MADTSATTQNILPGISLPAEPSPPQAQVAASAPAMPGDQPPAPAVGGEAEGVQEAALSADDAGNPAVGGLFASTLMFEPKVGNSHAPFTPRIGLDAAELVGGGSHDSPKPVRAVVLSLLRLEERHVLWHIGAGSGAFAIEAASILGAGRICAIERHAERAVNIRENRFRYGAFVVDVHCAQAPACLPPLPDPQRVFVAGGLNGPDSQAMLEHVCQRLPIGGRFVALCPTLDSLERCLRHTEPLGWQLEIMQMQISLGLNSQGGWQLAAQNPLFLLAAQKP